MLAVHFVVEYVVLLDGAESSETDMESYESGLDTARVKLIKKLGRKVKSRSRSCRRAEFARVDCLVALLISKFFRNIGRQRHLSHIFKSGEKVSLALEFYDSVAVVPDFNDLGDESASAERESCADLCFFAGAGRLSPRSCLPSAQAGGIRMMCRYRSFHRTDVRG